MVSVALIVTPPRVGKERRLAVFHRQIMEVAVAAEWRKEFAFAARPHPHHHAGAFVGRDCSLRTICESTSFAYL